MSFFSALKSRLTRRSPVDKYVVWVTLALAAVGVVAVYSAVSFFAEARAGGSTEQFLAQHVVRVSIALAVMAAFSLVDYRTLARYSRIGLIGAIGLLLAVQIVGVATGGAQRWIRIAGIGFQPSDLARVALVLYVAVLLAQKQSYVKSFSRAFLPLLFWTFLTVGLIGLEDLSTAAVTLAAVLLMCFVGRVSTWQLGGLGTLGLGLAALLIVSSPERADRVESYLGMNLFDEGQTEQVDDRQGEGYQAHQARIAVAMGGLTGVGPGKSVQRDFLPAPYNDFIFAIIAEEYGAIGAFGLLFAFCVLLFRGFLRIARDAPDPLGAFLATGFTTLLVLYGFVHAGVSCGLLPVTGLPMPFVSYGGTSMVASGMMVGILLNISRHVRRDGRR
jgi:cell division protein FtsW